jgi:hypothetical protein
MTSTKQVKISATPHLIKQKKCVGPRTPRENKNLNVRCIFFLQERYVKINNDNKGNSIR